MKNLRFYCLLSSFVLIFLINIAQANPIDIWKVKPSGIENNLCVKEGIIDYQIPSWWAELPYYKNPNFPSFLYSPCDMENKVQAIKINFTYLQDYNNPTLQISVIKPEVIDPDNPYYLEVQKELILFPWSQEINQAVAYWNYFFPLGYIKKGLHEQNRIIIKISGPYRIKFDTLSLSLDNKDTDGDGVNDDDEGDVYQSDNRIVSIPIKNYNPYPLNPKKIILQIKEISPPRFREVMLLNPNTVELPEWLKSDLFLPFDILGFKVEEITPQEHTDITFSYTDKLYSSVQFYIYQDSNVWQETAYELLDGNTAQITLRDGGSGDFDGEKDGIINARLTLAYPKGLDIHLQKESCFIRTLIKEKKRNK